MEEQGFVNDVLADAEDTEDTDGGSLDNNVGRREEMSFSDETIWIQSRSSSNKVNVPLVGILESALRFRAPEVADSGGKSIVQWCCQHSNIIQPVASVGWGSH